MVTAMVLEVTSKLRKVGRYGVTIYAPSALAQNSQFPFKEGQVLQLRIDAENQRLIGGRQRITKRVT